MNDLERITSGWRAGGRGRGRGGTPARLRATAKHYVPRCTHAICATSDVRVAQEVRTDRILRGRRDALPQLSVFEAATGEKGKPHDMGRGRVVVTMVTQTYSLLYSRPSGIRAGGLSARQIAPPPPGTRLCTTCPGPPERP